MKTTLSKIAFLSLILILVSSVVLAQFGPLEDGDCTMTARDLRNIHKIEMKIKTAEWQMELMENLLVKFEKKGIRKVAKIFQARIERLENKIYKFEDKIDELSCVKPATFCGDGIIQQPNEAGTGGPNSDGNEQCDINDVIFEGWGYHCSPDCSIARCSLGQDRPCTVPSTGTGLQWCTAEGLWGECEISLPTDAPEYILQWGSFGDGDGEFNIHFGIATYGDNVYVTDRENHRVQKFDSNGSFILEWGSLGSGNGQFINADNVEVDSVGNVYVSDWDTNHIQKFDANGNFILMWGSGGAGDGQFSRAYGLAIDSSDNVYVADRLNSRVQKFDSSGNFITKWGSFGSGNGQFDNPTNIGVDSNDNLYTVEGSNHRVQKFDSSGNFITKWGSLGTGDGQFTDPYGIDSDSDNYIYVTDRNNHRVQKFEADGTYLTQWGSQGTGNEQFSFPADLSVDNGNNIYVVDTHTHRVKKFGN